MKIVFRSDLRQRDLRALELELLEIPRPMSIRVSATHHEAMLKAAIGASWIESPETIKKVIVEVEGDKEKKVNKYYFDKTLVDDMLPNDCYRAGHAVSVLYNEFTSLDPNSSGRRQNSQAAK